jgi:hypothetical protein
VVIAAAAALLQQCGLHQRCWLKRVQAVWQGQQVQQVQDCKVSAWHAPASLCSDTWPECCKL